MFTVKINGKIHQLDVKTPVLALIDEKEKKNYYAAKVNNRLRELNYELCYDCEVELLTLTSTDAVKVYETSFRYLLAMAFFNLYPDIRIRIHYNVSRSLLVQILEPSGIVMDFKMVKAINDEMERLVKEDYPFIRMTMSKEEAHQFYLKHHYDDKDGALRYRPEKMCHFYNCNGYLNYMYGYMVPSCGYLSKFRVFNYGSYMVAQYPRAEANGEIPKYIDEPTFGRVLKKAHQWAKICNAETIAKMNEHVNKSTDVDFINMCETNHNDLLHELGNEIVKDIENIRLICIAGPSSSGKTTFSNRLRIELMSRGITPLRISLDMYYKEKNQCPLDEDGKPDFEHVESLDLELFNEQMVSLINGEEVELPIFDFSSGRTKEGVKTKIDSKTPIIIEGIHALNDRLSFAIPKHQKFKIFIAPQFQINIDNDNPISFTDVRLLRRIVRDKKYRGTSAEQTLEMWPSVRRGEFKWIYPFQEGCNFVYNSALTYELCVMKKYALPALQEIKPDNPNYITANRLIKFLKYFKDIDDKWVPCNSLLREFIGGSCFQDV